MTAPVIKAALALGTKQVRIADEFNSLMNIAAWIRESVEFELNNAFSKEAGVPERSVKKFSEAVKAFDTLIAAKVRLDKSSKTLADNMTPEDEMNAVRSYIRSLDVGVRGAFLTEEQQWHLAAK